MAETPTATETTDQSGIARTNDGTIVDGQTTQTDQQTDQSNQNTTQQTTQTNKDTGSRTTLLNQKAETKTDAKADGEKKDDVAKTGAPETYADYKLPEGYTLDPAVKTKADALFKDLGLSQDGAQKAVDLFRELTEEAFQQPFTAFDNMVKEWGEEAANHPDLKGKLGPGQEVNTRIAKALDALNDATLAQDFRNLMDLTGAGNHPAFIRAINAWSKMITEGGHVRGNGPTTAGQTEPGKAPPSAAGALWPNLPSSRTN